MGFAVRDRRRPARRQRGVTAVVAAICIVALVAMTGLVVDLGHLYVLKTELQTAADACALAAARELKDAGASPTSHDRIVAAGVKTASLNNANLQKDAVAVQNSEVTFAETIDGAYSTSVTTRTVYVRCAPHEDNVKSVALWFMGVVGLSEATMTASAIARPTGSQTFCAIPIAMCTQDPGAAGLGLVKGTWYSGRLAAGTAKTGNYEWIRFHGQGTKTLGELLAKDGNCDDAPMLVDAEPGVSQGAAQAWNTRFGLYAGTWKDMTQYLPDHTGWAYTPNRVVTDNKGNTITIPGSWPKPEPQNAYDDYVLRADVTHDPYNPSALLNDKLQPMNLPGNPSPLAQSLHASLGQDRRMVFTPIIACNEWEPNKKDLHVLDYACSFMISPINDPGTDVQLEFRGLRTGGCGTTGFPGGFGPPVPGLVR